MPGACLGVLWASGHQMLCYFPSPHRLQREIQLAQKTDYPANKLPQIPPYDKLSVSASSRCSLARQGGSSQFFGQPSSGGLPWARLLRQPDSPCGPFGLCWWQGALCAPAGPGWLAPGPGKGPLCPSLWGRPGGGARSAGMTVSMPRVLLALSLQPGDRKLAQSAQMYHYQHQKQQMLSLEKCVPRCGDGFKVLPACWVPLPSSWFLFDLPVNRAQKRGGGWGGLLCARPTTAGILCLRFVGA